jgi:hypothetical protein
MSRPHRNARRLILLDETQEEETPEEGDGEEEPHNAIGVFHIEGGESRRHVKRHRR